MSAATAEIMADVAAWHAEDLTEAEERIAGIVTPKTPAELNERAEAYLRRRLNVTAPEFRPAFIRRAKADPMFANHHALLDSYLS